MKPSIVQLIKFALLQFSFRHELDSEASKNHESRNLGVEMAAQTIENTDELTALGVVLRIRVNATTPEAGRIVVEAEAKGRVHVMRSTPDKTRAQRVDLALLNGVALMFGTLRETIFHVTARSDAGALNLPALNFLGLQCTLDSNPYVLGSGKQPAPATSKKAAATAKSPRRTVSTKRSRESK